jgi:hypothetical protein
MIKSARSFAAGSYEGAASLFREAGTMAEDEGATVLSKVLAAEYAANPIQN